MVRSMNMDCDPGVHTGIVVAGEKDARCVIGAGSTVRAGSAVGVGQHEVAILNGDDTGVVAKAGGRVGAELGAHRRVGRAARGR